MNATYNVTDLLDGTQKGMLKVRLFVFLERKYGNREFSIDKVLLNASNVFRQDVSEYVMEWINSSTSIKSSPQTSTIKVM